MNQILIVDDEEDNLAALNRLLRTQFVVTTTTSAFEALRLVQKNQYSIVLSDQRMPEMSGVDLLEKAKKFAPDTIRILLTGYTDLESVIEAINRGNVYRYIAKPWNPDELKVILLQAEEAYLLHKALESQNNALELANEELRLALEALQRLDHAKAQFLSLISHELNTPLTVLLSFSALLQEKRDSLPIDARKASEAIAKAALRFQEIVTEVLTYIRIESGGALRFENCDISSIVKEASQISDKERKNKRIVFSFSLRQNSHLLCDRDKMKLAISNLLASMIKQAPEDSEIKIEVNESKISIWRKGQILASEAFNPLSNATKPLHHQQDLGLGLAICKLIVEAHRGSIEVHSTKEAGTTVSLVF